jgi:outer membrane protein assembly factor BamE (lipoprotein component of BamABCDE complex)
MRWLVNAGVLRRSRLSALLAGSVLLLGTGGCTIGRYYYGAPLRAEPSTIVQGESTKSDVLRLFGPPTQITHQTDGDAFVYTYEQINTSTFQVRDPVIGYSWFTYNREIESRDRLLILFNFAGIVRSVAIEHEVERMPIL